MINYNTYSIKPNVRAGVRHEGIDLTVAVSVSFGPIQQEPEAKRTLTP